MNDVQTQCHEGPAGWCNVHKRRFDGCEDMQNASAAEADFDERIKDLLQIGMRFDAEVVEVEKADKAYWSNDRRLRCIVVVQGIRYWSFYD